MSSTTTYQITAPDGRVFKVTAPKGVTKEQVVARVTGQYAAPPPPPESSPGTAAVSGAWKGILGTLDLAPAAVAGPVNYIGRAMGFNPNLDPRPFSRAGAALNLGTFQPQTPGEERASFAGEVLGASALPAAGLVSRAAAPTRTLLTEAAAAGGAAAGGLLGAEAGGDLGQAVGTIAGGFAPAAAPWAARTVVSPAGQAQMAPTLAAAQRQGLTLSAGEAAGGSALEKASATLPLGGRMGERFRQAGAEQMGQRVDDLISQLTARETSAEAAGRSINRGIDQWTDNFRARYREMDDRVAELIPPTTPTPLPNTLERLKDLVKDKKLSEILDAPLVRQLNRVLAERGAVPYEVARDIRSRIGERTYSPELIADISRGQAKRLYGAISEDLREAARAAGPEAERLYERSNRFYSAGMQRIDEFLDPIQKRNIPENVYRAAIQGTTEGASRIRTLKRSLEPEQWRVVAGTVLRRLGRVRPSERTTGTVTEEATDFSPETFLTNMERIDPSARKVLFSGSQYEGLENNLQDLQTVAQAIRAQRQVLYNPSGTAGALYNAAGLAAPLATLPFSPEAAMQIGGGLAANVALQKALQTPSIVNYLANPTQFTPSVLPQVTRGAAVAPGVLDFVGQ